MTYLSLKWNVSNSHPYFQELELARYYAETGQLESAIEEYNKIIYSGLITDATQQAHLELRDLLTRLKNSQFGVQSYIVYLSWFFTPKMYITSAVLFITSFLFLMSSPFLNNADLALMPFHDFSDLKIGEYIPQYVISRTKALEWKFQHLRLKSSIFSDAVDLPVFSFFSDEGTLDVTTILNTALMFSGGLDKLPISEMLNSLRLWLQQPKYIVRGDIKPFGNVYVLNIMLFDRKIQDLVKIWTIQVCRDSHSKNIPEIVDAIIYPLMHHFGKKVVAKNWKALKSFNDGLEELDYYYAGNYDVSSLLNSRQFFEKALELDPNYTNAGYNLGLLLLQIGEYEDAKEIFTRIASSNVHSDIKWFALYNYCVTLFQISQDWSYHRAKETLVYMLDNAKSAKIKYMASAALAVTCARLAERDIKNRAIYIESSLNEVQKIKKYRQSLEPSVLSTALAAEGHINAILGKLDDAIACFVEAIKVDNSNITALIGLGDAYVKNNQLRDAVSILHQAELYAPSSGYPSYKLGNIYRELGDVENAILAYKRASKISLAYLALGKIYLHRGEYLPALDEFKKAVAQNKKNSEGWVNIAWVICEMDTADDELIKFAEESARRALQLEKNQKRLWHRHAVLSRVLLLRGKKDKALVEAKRAVELSPSRPQALYYLALAEYSAGNIAKALEIASRVIESDDTEWRLKAEIIIEQCS